MQESTVCIPIPQPASPVILAMPAVASRTPRKRRRKMAKPEKPRPDFPLFPHATKRWAKKIRGKMHYFGHWDDPQKALDSYLAQKEDLHAGRTPRAKVEGLTLDDACQLFLHAKRQAVAAGELTERSWQDYAKSCTVLLAHFGRTRLVTDLMPDDFARLRAELAKTRGPVTLGNDIIRIRVVLKHAADNRLIPGPVHMGTAFKKPSAKSVRVARAEKGARMFEPEELRRILMAAKLPLKCWVLLGVNCGFGNADCARLPLAALDLAGGWVNYHREKTGIPRRAKLWPETVEAIREWLDVRPPPVAADDGGLVFLTSAGETFYKPARGTATGIGNAMQNVLRKLKINGHRNFYALRHTFETVAGESRDQVAVDHVMGHVDPSMAATYRERIGDERLATVAAHVRGWLFGKGK